MNEIQTDKIQYDVTREEYEYAEAKEEDFNTEVYRKQLEKYLDILSSNIAFYCRQTSEYLA